VLLGEAKISQGVNRETAEDGLQRCCFDEC